MVKYIEEINYDELVEKSLRNVVYYALKIAEEQGLPGENHFYITFRTDFPGTKISKNLKIQYPETMTIVLQNQFKNLTVHLNSFSVDLSFGGISQTITVPYEGITYFADPFAKFGLSFTPEQGNDELSEDDDSELKNIASPHTSSATSQKQPSAQIISIDSYRRKK